MERRGFIKTAAVGSAAMATAISVQAADQKRKLKVGLVGAGWYGMVITKAALTVGGVEVIAICDVDSVHLNDSAAEVTKLQGTRPQVFKDYRDLLDVKGLEVLFIGTPPHWHALMFIAACEKGLDIYCEKPLAYDILEGLAMVKASQKAGNIVQIGFQRRQSAAFAKAKALIDSGTIGEVHQIAAQINYIPGNQDTTIQPPPASLDWEAWCGPAPKLEYRPNIAHKAWRLEKQYGNGHLVDWGIHLIDGIRLIMDETMPTEFYTRGGIHEWKNKITTPDTLTANMAFRKAPVVWQHRLWGTGDPVKEFNNGIFFHGEKGTLFTNDSKIILYPTGKDTKPEEMVIQNVAMQENHMENFLKAVRTREKHILRCTPEDAFQSTATVQLAMIALDSNSLVQWDSTKNEITGNKAASMWMKREYRGPYKHP